MKQANPKCPQKAPISRPSPPPTQSQLPHQKQSNRQSNESTMNKENQNNDIDWLEEIVHQFQIYKDLKGSSLFKDHGEDRGKCVSVGLTGKPVLGENLHCYSQSQRKYSMENNRKTVGNKNREIKHEVIHKNLVQSKSTVNSGPNRAITSGKSKRSESEGSNLNKNKANTALPIKNHREGIKLSSTHKQMVEFTNKNYDIEVFAIRDIKDDLVKMKNKLSMPETKANGNCKIGAKAAVVKENRKHLIQALSDSKGFGKIVKNKSIQLKQRKNTIENESGNRQKSSRNEIQNYLSQEMKRSIEKKEKLASKVEQPLKERNENEIKIEIQQKREEKTSIKGNSEGKENVAHVKLQSENKKYNYLVDGNMESRYERICNKKQRKLNSSFGERKILQVLIKNDASSSAKGLQCSPKLQTSPTIARNPQIQENNPNSVPLLSEFTTNPVLSRRSPQPRVHSPISESLSKLYNKVKIVESTKNSQVFTQHSIVLDKNEVQKDNQFLEMGADMKKGGDDWNIMQIFQKLDRKRLGTLSADNCSIEYVSREIRYILGTVLEEILYRDVKYTFSEFIQKVEKTLETVNEPSQSFTGQNNYQKLKQYAPSTRREATTTNPPPILTTNRLKDPEIPISTTKKYEYGKLMINEVETEPSKKNGHSNSTQCIRFATFQDEDIVKDGDSKENDIEIDIERLFPARTTQKYRQRQPDPQQKLDTKLCALNQFKSTLQPKNILLEPEAPLHESMIKIRPRCYSDATKKQQYKNEIVKLEMLNERLEKYLHDQTMKEFSSSKLLGDI